ncbi:MAG: DUF3830 family protein [Candidatus Limnocylindrales bacterium]
MSRVRILLGGVEAFAELDEVNAPETTRWLKEVLPIENRAIHSMENGREVYLVMDGSHKVPDENQTIYQTVGDLLVYYKPAIFVEPEWPRSVRDFLVVSFIYERDSAVRGISTALATNVVGTISEGLDALAHEAPRMRREGMGRLAIEAV